MKRVLSIVYNDLTNDNRVINQARSLHSEGYEVTLLGIQTIAEKPLNEDWEGIKVRRVKVTYDKLIYRFPFIRTWYHNAYLFIKFLKAASGDFDYIHCHDLNTLQFGTRIKLLRNRKVKLIYDAHEYETQRNGLKGWWWTYVKIKERILIRFCDRVITVSPTIADEYVRLYGIQKPALIFNCPILRSEVIVKKDLFRQKFNIPKSKKIFLYQGYLYPGRGIEVVLEAFDRLNLNDGILIFMGEGSLDSTIKQNAKYGKSVFVHPFVSGEVLLNYTSSADYGISFIEDISLSDRYCLPNKLFEYIAAGLPVISSGLPDLKAFVITNEVGVAATTNDVEGFIEAFKNLPDSNSKILKENILRTRAQYNWGTQEQVLFELYESL